jgi:ribonuclease HII
VFGFCENKGYATRDHRDAIEVHGPSPVHRLSFAGVGQPALPGFGQTDAARA